MMQTIRSRFLTVICGVSLTLTLVFGSLCVFLVDRIVRPLHDISEAARRWAAANMTSLWTVRLKMKSGGLPAI